MLAVIKREVLFSYPPFSVKLNSSVDRNNAISQQRSPTYLMIHVMR